MKAQVKDDNANEPSAAASSKRTGEEAGITDGNAAAKKNKDGLHRTVTLPGK